MSNGAGISKSTTALHAPASVSIVMSEGQVAFGSWLSSTVTVNSQVSVFSASSVAVTVTVVVPKSKVEPDAIEATEVAPQLSSGAGISNSTTALHTNASVSIVMSEGQVAVGSSSSGLEEIVTDAEF